MGEAWCRGHIVVAVIMSACAASRDGPASEVLPPQSSPSRTAAESGGSRRPRPGWVDGRSQDFSPAVYVLGVGTGSDRVKAADAARAEISKFFHARVKADLIDRETTHRETGAAHGEAVRTEQDFVSMVQVSTAGLLQAVAIADVFDDGAQVYALATLDRTATIKKLANEIDALAGSIREETERATSGALLDRAACLFKAEQSALRIEPLHLQLSILDPQHARPAPAFPEDLHRQARQILAKVLVGVEVSGASSSKVRGGVSEAITRAGFSLQSAAKAPGLKVRCRCETSRADSTDVNWVFVRWNLQVEISDASHGKIIGAYDRSGREGHKTWAAATKRAEAAMRSAASAEVEQALLELTRQQSSQVEARGR